MFEYINWIRAFMITCFDNLVPVTFISSFFMILAAGFLYAYWNKKHELDLKDCTLHFIFLLPIFLSLIWFVTYPFLIGLLIFIPVYKFGTWLGDK